jgi:dTDP-4-amino-4,6-dideoxygalactose transaminase
MMNRKIKFNIPYYTEHDVDSIRNYLIEGSSPVNEVTGHLAKRTGSKAVYLTAGATSAMDLFFAAAEYPEGSEVIMPSFTFPAAANAVIRAGLKPVFSDIDIETMVMSASDVIKNITEKTCCIMPVHYGGASMDMDWLLKIAAEHHIDVFEDSALSYLGYYKKNHLGTLGRAGVLSFHSTKNLSGDGGGALLLNDKNLAEKTAELLANGTNRPAFMRGEVSEYSWQRTGTGTAMSGLTASLLKAQLDKDMDILKAREKIWNTYFTELSYAGITKWAALPLIPGYNKNNWHVFYLRFNNKDLREYIRNKLLEKGIEAVIHYKPLHSSAMGKTLGYSENDLPKSEEAAACLLRLPLHMFMSEDDVKYICKTISAVLEDA